MAITYPVSWPASVMPSRVQFSPHSVVALSESPFSLAQQVYAWPGQRWKVDADIGPLGQASGSVFRAFLLSLNGRYGTFLFGDPTATTPRGTALGTPLVDGASQTGATLATKGWNPSQTGVLLAGDYIQLGTGSTSKLHQVLVDANADASGEATLDIWPSLRSSPADEAAITVSSCKGVFRLSSNDMAWSLESPTIHSFTMSFTEAL